mgnify:CR=1 FL=1
MKITMWNEKENTLYIRTEAIMKAGLGFREGLAYMKKPYEERQKIFEENPEAFRAAMAELSKHPGCTVSEFMMGPSI